MDEQEIVNPCSNPLSLTPVTPPINAGPRQLIEYSICITHRNNASTVEASLRSILEQIGDDFEVVVVDAKSSDGSGEILSRIASEKKIRLIERNCSRGLGRQVALEDSSGRIVISNLDMDEVYSPGLLSLLEFYEKHADGKVLLVLSATTKAGRGRQNVTIAPRQLLRELGGWRDVNYGEDWDLWRRAAERNKFAVVEWPLVTGPDPSEGRPKLRSRYTRYVAMIQLGREVFEKGQKVTLSQRGVYLWARLVALNKPRFGGPKRFDAYDEKYRIPNQSS